MTSKKHIKLIREGEFIVEVEVELLYDDNPLVGWSPYLSLQDAYRLDDIRQALRNGDFEVASRLGRIFRLTPLAV